MATQEEILEDIRESKGEIRELKGEIRELETQSKETTDEELKKRNDTKISDKTKLLIAKQETLTALITSQQGNFLFTYFHCPFPNPLDVIHCPIFFDISSSPIQVRQSRKVRGD